MDILKSTKIGRYLQGPTYLLLLFVPVEILFIFINGWCAVILGTAMVVAAILQVYSYYHNKAEIIKECIQLVFEQGEVQQQLVRDLPIPYVLVDADGAIIWSNGAFCKATGDNHKGELLGNIFQNLPKNLLPTDVNHSISHVDYVREKDGREEELFYKVEFTRITAEDFSDENGEWYSKHMLKGNSLVAAYFFDQTMLKKYMDQNEDQRLIIGMIYIDNYDEAFDELDEVKKSMLVAVAERKINSCIQNAFGVIKKTAKDKYFILLEQRYLEKMKANNFAILEEIKNINLGNSMHLTLSISLGMNGDSYQENYEAACAGMDLALGRGGDQVVIRDGQETYYYGGNSEVVERNTRVKARVKAQALCELVESKEKVIIMAHKIPDPDAIGAAIGLYRLGCSLGKKAHIVLNEETISIRPIVYEISSDEAYDEMFITSEEAMEMTDDNTLLIIVDVNHTNYTECEELLGLTRTVVLLDHHRKSQDMIENPVLSYVEPYASSTCEMVAEILQYVESKPKLEPIEANAMYYGMLVDTDNFVNKTGVRTFEAAAYLRRNGADLNWVRKMTRENMETYRIRSKAISDADILYDKIAIATLVGIGIDSPTVMGAQVANELLDIDGIEASFVMTGVKERVYVSARSIDEVNVQRIMEQFGGGGHLTVAGAQLVDVSLDEAKEIIVDTLKHMKEKGEI